MIEDAGSNDQRHPCVEADVLGDKLESSWSIVKVFARVHPEQKVPGLQANVCVGQHEPLWVLCGIAQLNVSLCKTLGLVCNSSMFENDPRTFKFRHGVNDCAS